METVMPKMPTVIPSSTTKPSLPKSPKEVIKMPSPGMKLESGIGSKMNEEKSREKNPIKRSAVLVVMKARRGFRMSSILRM